jgi:predicted adenine nucleotide alpha hydrolase (AANH) superfamily ATPase
MRQFNRHVQHDTDHVSERIDYHEQRKSKFIRQAKGTEHARERGERCSPTDAQRSEGSSDEQNRHHDVADTETAINRAAN